MGRKRKGFPLFLPTSPRSGERREEKQASDVLGKSNSLQFSRLFPPSFSFERDTQNDRRPSPLLLSMSPEASGGGGSQGPPTPPPRSSSSSNPFCLLYIPRLSRGPTPPLPPARAHCARLFPLPCCLSLPPPPFSGKINGRCRKRRKKKVQESVRKEGFSFLGGLTSFCWERN